MSQCTDLVANASAGAAPALRAVDCMANQTAASAFSRLFGTEGSLLPALTILLTLYIAIFAFALITGRSKLGVSALTPRMLMLGLVLTFATSWMAFQQFFWNLVVGAPDQIAGIIMGSSGSASAMFADRIDMVMVAIAEVAAPAAPAAADGSAQPAANAASTMANGGAFSPQGAMWLGTMLLLLGTVGVLVTSRIALAVLLATGPVFVVLALFGGTRGLTAGWLRALVLTAITPLFVTLGGSLMLELVVPVVAGLRGAAGAVDVRAAMALFLLACVHCALMVMMFKVAGTMVSAWNVFGLGSSEAMERPATASPVALLPPPAAFSSETASAAALSRATMVMRAGAEQAGMAPSPAPSGSVSREIRNSVITNQSPPPGAAASSLPRLRARGIGSRFAAARNAAPREMMR